MAAPSAWERNMRVLEDLRVGKRVLAAWRDGSEHEAVVLDQRPKDPALRRRGLPFVDPSKLPLARREYYLHYEGHDKRLDEWAAYECLVAVARADEDDTTSCSAGTGDTLVSAATAAAGRPLRARKRRASSLAADSTLQAMESEHAEATKIKNIQTVQFGRWEVDCWYYSPYPDEYCVDHLFLCEHTLRYFRRLSTLRKHEAACELRSPPGTEIYRDMERSLCVFEVDGREHKEYCQNLCLLAKLFLDHKTLYFDVDPFYFYVLCETDEEGAHIVGYFSKEKHSPEGFNLSCILTLPPYQRKGYGKFLISLSYELSKREGKTGSPERPLSDLGRLSYRSYWGFVILSALASEEDGGLTIRELSDSTRIRVEDIVSTLQDLGLVKLWKGQHVVSISEGAIDRYVKGSGAAALLCKPSLLAWPQASGSKTPAKAALPSQAARRSASKPRTGSANSSDSAAAAADSAAASSRHRDA
ncbi:hypothetical protein FNF31_01553 [Cafeteria roenbergensis]|uniref:Histone acetyltransferase n=1 Tax=Cafeteria roenbergensis TaxID=33653 RepID=A0A5A8DMF5_CAFRO|nr:hypothetical protein FNF31_01553 [Cafeteria roenbergensis]KAA0168209.1 hypothetical protein FNF28_02627 [Cafeteria roenbergensis]